eukprot:gnl/MRDRNA2_/MRDRNA2_88555_c0_seq1.p1 gnl/MRDRNA2_/MRDRNA2_88555_c0~~gnl/MRDRNA2_/MRDRNA2_88555_c0_seq1.p1  ORF type:complete len:225 (-),score=37.90 gnl/MRDRNA2_/MRDRNA2_88555_c0_seq1:254-928(-)
MALYSLFQEAFTAPSSARDFGQEMLHASLLLSCAFVGWCASSMLVSACGWAQNCPDEGKAKEGSSIFREEVAAYVQQNNVKDAAKHFGLSCTEIRNCIDAVEQSQCGKIHHIWQSLQDAVVTMITQLSASAPPNSKEATLQKECEDICNYSIAPTVKPGMLLLEQYGVFGASTGTWSGPLQAELDNDVPEKVNTSFACSHGYGGPSHQSTDGPQRVWVPLEYTW